MPLAVPPCDLRASIGRIRTIAAAALLVLPACSFADGGLTGTDSGARMGDDAGPGGALDAGFADGDASVPPAPEDPELQLGGDAACFNGLDDDADLAPDCAEAACGEVPYCCVGAARAGCCVGPGMDLDVRFNDCTGPDPRDCGATVDTFGSPAPILDGRGVVPGGDDLTDAGLLLGPPIDLRRERVSLGATILSSPEMCTGPGCIDVVALGLGEPPTASRPTVRPLVGVYVRRSRGDVALVITGDVVDSRPLVTDQPVQYDLEVTPDGRVTLQMQGEATPMTGTVAPRMGMRPMLWGRTFEIASPELPTAAAEVRVVTRGCDMPDSLVRDAAPAIPFAGPTFVNEVRNPSAVADGDQTLLAFVYQDAIHLARQEASTWSLAGSGSLGSPVLSAGINERYDDPHLVRRDDRYDLYLTRIASDGSTSIVMLRGDTGFSETFGAPEEVDTPPSLRSPAVLDRDGQIYLAAVTELDSTEIVLLTATDPVGPFTYVGATAGESVIAKTGDGLGDFAVDEVADPMLFVGGRGLLRLYYAGRRGTRWSIGARVSGGVLSTWRSPVDGQAIAAGSGAGYDALSLRAPSVVLLGDSLHLYTTSTDGVFRSIGHAVGSAP